MALALALENKLRLVVSWCWWGSRRASSSLAPLQVHYGAPSRVGGQGREPRGSGSRMRWQVGRKASTHVGFNWRVGMATPFHNSLGPLARPIIPERLLYGATPTSMG